MCKSSRMRVSLSFIRSANLTLSFAYFFLCDIIRFFGVSKIGSLTYLNERYDCLVGGAAGTASGKFSVIWRECSAS